MGGREPAVTFFETSALLIMFVVLGKYLETAAKGKTSDALSALLSLQPSTATVVVEDAEEAAWLEAAGGARGADGGAAKVRAAAAADDDVAVPVGGSVAVARPGAAPSAAAAERVVPLVLLAPGDLVKVYPGGGIPADGVVEGGAADVDESMITGESVPVRKEVGSEVVGATVSTSGLLLVRVTSVGGDSVLSQIVKLVEDAQMSKAPIQAVADYISSIFAPAVFIIAIVTFVVWLAVMSSAVAPDGYLPSNQSPFLFSILFGISVLVIACPCALGLATPTAVMVGTGLGARNGMLIKGGAALETAHNVDAIIFDKTGTLTEGKPSLTELVLLPPMGGDIAPPPPLPTLLRLVATVEAASEHPLGRALKDGAMAHYATARAALPPGARGRHPPTPVLYPLAAEDVSVVPGLGLKATLVDDGGVPVTVAVGNRGFMAAEGAPVLPSAESQMLRLERRGRTAVLVALNGVCVAVAGIADRVKSEAADVVAALSGMGVEVWMVTGDNARTAAAVADVVGIPPSRVMAGVRPGDKAGKVASLQAAGHTVAMVGDGINDSPALAAANVGMAIGAGAQIAVATAAIVLIRSDLRDVVAALDLSRVVYRRIMLNFMWALGYNTLGIPIAAGLFFPLLRRALPPEVAGIAMALSSVSVVLSSLALKRYRRPDVAALAVVQHAKDAAAKRALTPAPLMRTPGGALRIGVPKAHHDGGEAVMLTAGAGAGGGGGTSPGGHEAALTPLVPGSGAGTPATGVELIDLSVLRPACGCGAATCSSNRLATVTDWDDAFNRSAYSPWVSGATPTTGAVPPAAAAAPACACADHGCSCKHSHAAGCCAPPGGAVPVGTTTAPGSRRSSTPSVARVTSRRSSSPAPIRSTPSSASSGSQA